MVPHAARPSNDRRQSRWWPRLARLLLAVLIGGNVVFFHQLLTNVYSPAWDFAEYWAAARLFLSGGNPYDPVELLALQQAVDPSMIVPLMMWNPPWTLPLVAPLGFLSFGVGRIAWLLLQMGLLVGCCHWLWRYYGGPARLRPLAWLLPFAFFPAVYALRLGQITPLLLPGLVLFLAALQRRRFAAAGSALLLIAVKPHLLYLFWIALLLWSVQQKRWRLLLGGAGAGALALILVLMRNPQMLQHYLDASGGDLLLSDPGVIYHAPTDWMTASLGSMLRVLLPSRPVWALFVPAAAAAFWLCWYWWRRRSRWRWKEELPLLVAISLSTGAFVWAHFDPVIFLLPLVQVAALLVNRGNGREILLVVLLYDAINSAAFMLTLFGADAWHYVWLPPCLLVVYLILTRRSSARASTAVLSAAGSSVQ